MRSPRLLFFITEDWFFCSHRLPLAIAAKEAGYDVSVMTRVCRHGDIIRDSGIKLIPFESDRHSLNPFALIRDVIRLSTIYRRESPDIVHHVALKPVISGSLAARLAGVKQTVNAVAGIGWLYSSNSRGAKWLGFIVRRTLGVLLSRGLVIVQNPDDRTWLLDLGISEKSIRLIRGSGVDIREFQPRPRTFANPAVMLIARMLWSKGVNEFVEASKKIRERGIGARFILVGAPDPGNPSSIPETQLRKWDSEGIVEWWGRCEDMPEVLAQAHIACLPSYYGEGVPKSLLEAAATGLPIVTTDSPGCREVVEHNVNGLLVPPRDAVALADALCALLQDPERCASMGVSSRERAEREFSVDQVAAETLALYRECLS